MFAFIKMLQHIACFCIELAECIPIVLNKSIRESLIFDLVFPEAAVTVFLRMPMLHLKILIPQFEDTGV